MTEGKLSWPKGPAEAESRAKWASKKWAKRIFSCNFDGMSITEILQTGEPGNSQVQKEFSNIKVEPDTTVEDSFDTGWSRSS